MNGELVPERDANALAQALRTLHNDSTLGKRLGSAGREKVLHEFNLLHNTAALYQLLVQDWSAQNTTLHVLANATAVD